MTLRNQSEQSERIPDKMKAFIPLVVLIALIPLIISIPLNPDGQKLYEGQRKFSIKLLHALHKSAHGSRVVSPYSIYHGLLMLYFGAEGETEMSLKRALYLDWANSKEDVIRAYQLLNQMNIHPEIEFRNVSRLYVTDKAVLKPSMSLIYRDNIEKVNYAQDPIGIIKHINRHIARITNGHIKHFYSKDLINPNTNLILINVAYLRGRWQLPFNRNWTILKNFYGYETVEVPMMRRHGQYVYGRIEKLNSLYLRLPYLGEHGALSMYVLLPTERSSSAVDNLINGLSIDILDKILAERKKSYVSLEIPRFEIETRKSLGELLPVMGVENLFDNINLNGISDSLKLNLDDLNHYSKIGVNEWGSLDAAISGSYVNESSEMRSGNRFIADHPFVYVIYDRLLNGILMAGVYRGPSHH